MELQQGGAPVLMSNLYRLKLTKTRLKLSHKNQN